MGNQTANEVVTPPTKLCQRHSWDVKAKEMKRTVDTPRWRHYDLFELVECSKCKMRKWRRA